MVAATGFGFGADVVGVVSAELATSSATVVRRTTIVVVGAAVVVVSSARAVNLDGRRPGLGFRNVVDYEDGQRQHRQPDGEHQAMSRNDIRLPHLSFVGLQSSVLFSLVVCVASVRRARYGGRNTNAN